MAIATTAQAILRGRISIYLAANDNANGALFGARLASPSSPITIAMVTDALAWGSVTGAQSVESVREVTNYLIWLIGIYGQEAQYISGGIGGGSVIPGAGVSTPSRVDFYATDSTFLVTGQDTATITQWIGYNLQFERGNVPQATANNGTDSYFTWNKVTGDFFCYGAVNDGELISLIPYL